MASPGLGRVRTHLECALNSDAPSATGHFHTFFYLQRTSSVPKDADPELRAAKAEAAYDALKVKFQGVTKEYEQASKPARKTTLQTSMPCQLPLPLPMSVNFGYADHS